jgi:hypothetical protein
LFFLANLLHLLSYEQIFFQRTFSMAMQYFNQIKNRRRSSLIPNPPKPVLTPEDEAFLQKVTSDPEHRSDSAAQNEAQDLGGLAESSQKPVVDGSALDVPLPSSPVEEFGKELGEEERKAREQPEDNRTKSEPAKPEDTPVPEKKKRWSSMFSKKAADAKKVCTPAHQGCSFQLQDLSILIPQLNRISTQPLRTSHRPRRPLPLSRQQLQRITETKRGRTRKT